MVCGRRMRGLCKVYDSSSAMLVLPGVDLRWSKAAHTFASTTICQTDDEILQMCSTSPNAELPGFAAGMPQDIAIEATRSWS